MKLIAVIFSLFVLFMPLQPVISGINCIIAEIEKAEALCCEKVKSCCARLKTLAKTPLQKCEKKSCPIEIGSSYYYVGTSKLIIEKPCIVISKEIFAMENDDRLSSFNKDCFHPPEFM